MSLRVSAEHIEKVFWRVFDASRGKEQLREPYFLWALSLFLLKFLSDLAREKEECPSQFSREWPLWDSLDIPARCSWRKVEERLPGPVMPLVSSILREVGNRNWEILGDAFELFSMERDEEVGRDAIYAAVMLFSQLDLRPSSLSGVDLGTVYEMLLEKFAESQGSLGEFYVPEEVAALVARLTEPQRGETVYDPFCRSGQLLTQLAKHRKDVALLAGQARNYRDASLARVNMLLRGWGASRIEASDPISSPLLDKRGGLLRFDIVVSNPPFGLGNWAVDMAWQDPFHRFRRGVPPSKMADYAFISHIVESMQRESGRSVVVVSLGTLSRGGGEASIRKEFVEENLIHGIIELPGGLFSATKIPVALMMFKRERKERRVLFVDASRGFLATPGRNCLRSQDVDRIIRVFEEFETVEEFSYLASIDEIRENDFNLRVSRYVRRKNVAARHLSEVWAEAQPIQEELDRIRGELDGLLRSLNLLSD